ncbi:hypothetical protein CHGG_01546 [Chaetomium globosum CBS 148.51]|uniref:Ribosome maturation protein SDO1/SBDS N-terminal domain-containing protein n=1 Tax=Chaetomium globosum (strain ATCC 6205 / CBS 148.51 / DSM 1962 / NBRC 6347 / NRRL 1970) TaxID=306901 RepID=Q2HE08_CHAGB|nr:uncharacterized protein CHGG_01546 [Chaetomium globosum CBS 148.51]EAQ93311.1 hypothetical protein CHGG_01546 [Chaetomium globosum CBS 148.51]
MARGEANSPKVHYKSSNDEDFVVFLDSVESYQKWLGDKSVPLPQVVSSFKIFTTHGRVRQGHQGILDGVSNAMLENEFGTSKDEDAVFQILEKGRLQEFSMPEREGRKNDSKGGAYVTR